MMQMLVWLHILGLFGTGIWMVVVYANEVKQSKKEQENAHK